MRAIQLWRGRSSSCCLPAPASAGAGSCLIVGDDQLVARSTRGHPRTLPSIAASICPRHVLFRRAGRPRRSRRFLTRHLSESRVAWRVATRGRRSLDGEGAEAAVRCAVSRRCHQMGPRGRRGRACLLAGCLRRALDSRQPDDCGRFPCLIACAGGLIVAGGGGALEDALPVRCGEDGPDLPGPPTSSCRQRRRMKPVSRIWPAATTCSRGARRNRDLHDRIPPLLRERKCRQARLSLLLHERRLQQFHVPFSRRDGANCCR